MEMLWKKKLELLIFSNLYLNLNVNQSEKIMQRPFVCLEGSIKLLDLIFCLQRCDISKNLSTWSDNDGVACNDGDRCTRNDNCSNGQCRGTLFSCNSICQYCNGNSCGLKTECGFSSSKCKCKRIGETFCLANENHTCEPQIKKWIWKKSLR